MFTDSEIETIATGTIDGKWIERLAGSSTASLARDFLHRFSQNGRPDPTVDSVLLAAVCEAAANELLVRHVGPLCRGSSPHLRARARTGQDPN